MPNVIENNFSKRSRTFQNNASNESITCVKSNILAIGSKQTSGFNRLCITKGIPKASIAAESSLDLSLDHTQIIVTPHTKMGNLLVAIFAHKKQ